MRCTGTFVVNKYLYDLASTFSWSKTFSLSEYGTGTLVSSKNNTTLLYISASNLVRRSQFKRISGPIRVVWCAVELILMRIY